MDTRAECGKGWADRCANSRGPSCRCRCGGRNHGKARPNTGADTEPRSKLTNSKVFERPLERELLHGAEYKTDIVLWREKDEHGHLEAQANISQRLVVHSPDGFEWGYPGSGPADLALNILAQFTAPQDAYALHQDYKDEVIQRLPEEGGTITAASVRAWLEAKFAEPPRPFWRVRESRTTSA